jgi:hypothetical protein
MEALSSPSRLSRPRAARGRRFIRRMITIITHTKEHIEPHPTWTSRCCHPTE